MGDFHGNVLLAIPCWSSGQIKKLCGLHKTERERENV